MRLRFILSETWSSLKRNVPMLLSVMLVTFISFLFIGASVLTQAQITKAKGDWYSKVEVVVWMCPDGTSQSVNCTAGTAATQAQINDLQQTIRNELADDVSQITFVSKEDFYNDTFLKQYPNGEYQGRTLTADDMQDSLWLKLKNPEKYQVVSEVLSGKEGVDTVRRIGRGDGGCCHYADRYHDSYVCGVSQNRNGNHAFGGCFELDDSIAVHSGRCDRVVGGFAAVLRHAFGIGQGVRH